MSTFIQDLVAALNAVDQLIQELEALLQATPASGHIGANGVLIQELIALIEKYAGNPAVLAILESLAAELPAPYNAIVLAILAGLNVVPTPTPVAA